jgi:CubicO group peptidase (beta-lactamase class C family)
MKPVRLHLSAVLLFNVIVAVQTAPAADVTPERVKAILPELAKFVEQTLKKTGVPGMAIAVVCKHQEILLNGFGFRDASKAERVDADTVFQLASVSKPMTSTVLAALVGERVIDWDPCDRPRRRFSPVRPLRHARGHAPRPGAEGEDREGLA